MNEYIGWPSNVNRVILDETTISVGKDATVSETLKCGRKRSELAGSFCPDVFSVVMDFEADDNQKVYDIDGQYVTTLDRTEHQLFTDWFKYKAKYGTVPFEFPKIVYTPGKGYSTEQGVMGMYRITSSLEMGKSGTCQRLRMTWEEVFSGDVTVEAEGDLANGVSQITEEYLDVVFSTIGDTSPVKTDFSLTDTVSGTDTSLTIKAYCFDGAYTARLYYNKLSAGEHTVTVTYKNQTFTASIDVEE